MLACQHFYLAKYDIINTTKEHETKTPHEHQSCSDFTDVVRFVFL